MGLTYVEFDNHVGPQLRYQYPADVMPMEAFEQLSEYVIVDKHLTNKVIVVQAEKFQYANYSVIIQNTKYERNALLFAFGILVEKNVSVEPYEVMLRKVSQTLVAMEIEKEFLFRASSKCELQFVLKAIYEQLMAYGEVFLPLDEANVIAVKLFTHCTQPPYCESSSVPMMLIDPNSLRHLPWDLSLHHVLPFIDGIRNVKKISDDAGMETVCAQKCIRLLAFYECLFISDVFKFSNVYQLSRNLDPLADLHLIDEIVAFSTEFPTIRRRASVLTLLLSLRPAYRLADVLTSSCLDVEFEGINLQRLVSFAQHKGVIVRTN